MLLVLNLLTFYTLVVAAGLHGTQDGRAQRSVTSERDSRVLSPAKLRDSNNEHLSFIVYHPTMLLPSASATSTTIPKADPSPKKNDTWTFKIESRNKGIQVGSWTTSVTYRGILNALRERCSQSKKGYWGANKCSPQDWGFYAEYTGKEWHWKEEKNTAIIKITSDYIPSEYGKPSQDAFVEQIANVYRLAATDDKNCYKYDPEAAICPFCNDKLCFAVTGPFKNKFVTPAQRLLRWCKAPDYVRVAVVDHANMEKAHMRVDLRFECPDTLGSLPCRVDLGRFDCVAMLAVGEKEASANKTRIGMLKTATRGKEFDVRTECESRDVTGSCPNAECLYQFGTCF
jgi:hypothetical protein